MLSERFRPRTDVVYPPFKNGRYLEEYVCQEHDRQLTLWQRDPACVDEAWLQFFESGHRILPAHWTYIEVSAQEHAQMQSELDALFDSTPNIKYVAVVQHDDGPRFDLRNTYIFGCSRGDAPLPEIYEDTTHYLETRPRKPFERKRILCSFVGSDTHPVRQRVCERMDRWARERGEAWVAMTKPWQLEVCATATQSFVSITLSSKFAMAPRGYGRSSFRFFEAMMLGTVPIYVYDDVCWLPDWCDWSRCAVVVRDTDIDTLPGILAAIDQTTYDSMVAEGQRVLAAHCTVESCLRSLITRVK